MDLDKQGVQYPRLIRRVRAFLIDSVLFIVLVFGWMILLPVIVEIDFVYKIMALVIPAIVMEPALVAFTGGSPGHHVMGLRVRHALHDQNIGLLRATMRAVVRSLFGWLSFVFVLVTQKHQALHDSFTSTIVVLRHPENLPAYERQAQRKEDHSRYRYPSRKRRVGVILLYILLSFLLCVALTAVLVSGECGDAGRCNAFQMIMANILVYAWLIGVGAFIVLGWRGLLWGCRRSPWSTL